LTLEGGSAKTRCTYPETRRYNR